MNSIHHKRGDTLELLTTIPAAFLDGHFAGWAMASHLRGPGGRTLVAVLDLSWIDAATTRHLLIRCADTSAWPVGRCAFDVQFTRPDGHITSTSTAAIFVVEDMTHA